MPRDSNAPIVPPPRPRRTPPVLPAMVAACVLCAPLTASFEGLRTKPYYDPAHVLTVCYGETERRMRAYTPAECLALLKDREATDYAPAVARCVPAFKDPRRRYAFAASIDAAYNAGTAAFCRSRMARAFNAGQWRRGCDGFLGWYATARINGRPTPLSGLQRRRAAERTLCLEDDAQPPVAPMVRADYPVCVKVHPAPLGPEPTNKSPYPHRLDAA